jgi:hypothetical protein
VRFQKLKGSYFLQIQTGKLIAMGVVDQSTIEWQKLPTDGCCNYIRFYFLSICYDTPKDWVITGLQFVSFKVTDNGWLFDEAWIPSLKLYGRKINFVEGTLDSTEQSSVLIRSSQLSSLEWYKGDKKPYKDLITFDRDMAIELRNTSVGIGLIGGCARNPWIDKRDVCIGAPISSIGLMHFAGEDIRCGRIRPYVKSLDYCDASLSDPFVPKGFMSNEERKRLILVNPDLFRCIYPYKGMVRLNPSLHFQSGSPLVHSDAGGE